MPNLTKIPIKKKDGSIVMMTMDEFKEYQKQKNSTPAVSDSTKTTQQQPKNIPKPVITQEEHLTTTTPVKNIFVDKAAANDAKRQWQKNDHKSLLEEKDIVVPNQKITPPNIANRTAKSNPSVLEEKKKIEKVLKKLKVQIPAEMNGRLFSLIQSRIKEIRTDAQVVDYTIKPIEAGGLGFSDKQAEDLLRIIKEVIMDQGNNNQKKQADTETKFVAAKPLESLDSITPPTPPYQKNNTEIKAPLNQNTVKPNLGTLPNPIMKIPDQEISENLRDKKNVSFSKPIIQDVVAPNPLPPRVYRTVGPVEEIKNFSLVDFRRLNNKPHESAELLFSKFQILFNESYLLYMQAKEAWHESPLYSKYLDVIEKCLNNKQKLNDALLSTVDSESLTGEEFNEILNVNRKLNG